MKSFIFFILIFLLVSCISLKIEIPDEPDGIVEYISNVKTIDRDSNFTKKIKNEKIFFTDSRVYVVIKVLNVGKRTTIKWKWFNPEKELVKSSEPVAINEGDRYLEYFVAWDSLENEIFKGKKGKWTVVVTLDDSFLILKEFTVN